MALSPQRSLVRVETSIPIGQTAICLKIDFATFQASFVQLSISTETRTSSFWLKIAKAGVTVNDSAYGKIGDVIFFSSSVVLVGSEVRVLVQNLDVEALQVLATRIT